MGSVADRLREETRQRVLRLDPSARVDLAFRLGDEDVALLSAARRISAAEARLVIARTRQMGRIPSKSAQR